MVPKLAMYQDNSAESRATEAAATLPTESQGQRASRRPGP